MAAVGILFLAHDGVANPGVWESWLASDPSVDVRFFVFCNESVRHGRAFVERHDLGVRCPTAWGTSSIVRATVLCYRKIYDGFPEVAVVYLVSGSCVPLQPPRFFFERSAPGSFYYDFRPFSSLVQYVPAGPVKRNPLWSRGPRWPLLRRHLRCHLQWCALSREHVRAVVEFPGLDWLYEEGDRVREVWCPDEWVLGTVLSLCGARGVRDRPTTDHVRERFEDEHPVTWSSWRVPRRFYEPWEDREVVCSLARRVAEARGHGYLFFRKVGVQPRLTFDGGVLALQTSAMMGERQRCMYPSEAMVYLISKG